jgi:hypothetical protein
MGFMRNPNSFNLALARRVRTTYYEILDALEARYKRTIGVDEARLKAAIIKRLMDFAASDSPYSDWKVKVLSSLSPRELAQKPPAAGFGACPYCGRQTGVPRFAA